MFFCVLDANLFKRIECGKVHKVLENGEYVLVHADDIYEEVEQACDYCNEDGEIYDEEYDEYETCYDCGGDGVVFESVKKQAGEDLGTLTALYLDLPNRAENRFTDDWTKTFDIRIGKPVTMPMSDCNWSTQDCAAAGLHFTADQIHSFVVRVLIREIKHIQMTQN